MSFDILKYASKDTIIKIVHDLWSKPLLTTGHWYDATDPMATIFDQSKYGSEHYSDDAKKSPAITLLDVILAARNNYQRNVLPRVNRLKKENPDLVTFDQLKKIVANKTPEEFYKFWDFKSPWKYQRVVEIVNLIPELQKLYPEASNDYELLHQRASHVDIDNLKEDIIGSIKGMWPATIQHLSMHFGVNTAKPDLRVMQVLEREFKIPNVNELVSIIALKQIASITNMSTLMIDQIFVKYWSSYYVKI